MLKLLIPGRSTCSTISALMLAEFWHGWIIICYNSRNKTTWTRQSHPGDYTSDGCPIRINDKYLVQYHAVYELNPYSAIIINPHILTVQLPTISHSCQTNVPSINVLLQAVITTAVYKISARLSRFWTHVLSNNYHKMHRQDVRIPELVCAVKCALFASCLCIGCVFLRSSMVYWG